MIYKYKLGVLIIFICSICFSILSKAQSMNQDSLINKQKMIQQVAYGTQPAWMVSGAISTVKGSELLRSFTTDLGNTLYGRLSGLTVRQGSGEPGLDSPTFNVRGLNTFGTGTAILVIIDGFESSFNNLIPYEIESINLLKDASATAMYGSNGANGVLLVTTKRGKESPLKVEFTMQKGFSIPTHQPKFLGSYDYATLYNEGLVNDGKPELYTATDLNAYKNHNDPYFHPDVDWYNEILRKFVPISNYNLNLSGGDKSIRYFLMLNMLKNDGLFIKSGDMSSNSINSDYQRFNFRSNVDINLGKRLLASVTVGGSIEQKNNPTGNNTSTIFNNMATIPPNAFPVYNPNGTLGGSSMYSNPLGDILQKGIYSSNARTYQATLKLTEQLDMVLPGLSISGAITFNNYYTYFSNKSRDYSRFSVIRNTSGDTTYTKIGQNTSLVSDESQSTLWRNFAVQGFINYNRTFGLNKVDAVMMLNRSNYTVGTGELPYNDAGIFGRFTYTNRDKYIGEISFGYNGSESFPKGKQYGLFPAVSVAWIASNEGFLKGSNIINYLKIRGSYGLTGNSNIGGSRRFLYQQNYNSGANYYLGTGNTATATTVEGQVATPDVTWEKQEQSNLGIEATVLKRIDLSLDIFNQDRYDILAKPYLTLPQYLGVSLPDQNVGKTNNKGFETIIRYNSDQNKDFQYFAQIDLFYVKNRIVYNSEATQLYDYLYKTDRQIGQPFYYECLGFFKNEDEIATSPVQPFQQIVPGDLKYKDQNGDGIINQLDLYPAGNPSLPKLTASMHLGFKYKGFDLDLMFQGMGSRTVYLSGNYFWAFQNNAKVSEVALGRWTPETASSATYPRLSASNNQNNYLPSTFWQRNGNFVKLRSVEFGYSLPETITKKLRLNSSRVFINGTNLISWDKMDFTDPETITGYPAMKTISIGIRIQL